MAVDVGCQRPKLGNSAGIAQLVERNLAKVEVASSNLVSRSIPFPWPVRLLSHAAARILRACCPIVLSGCGGVPLNGSVAEW